MERCGDKHAALLQTKAWSNNTDTLPLDTLCSVLLTTGPVSSLGFFFACLSLLTCLQQFVLKKKINGSSGWSTQTLYLSPGQ